MWKKIWRVLGRPKTGRTTIPTSVALTLEQIQFLKEIPNASEFIREILDDIITARDDIDSKFPSLKVQKEIEFLTEKAARAAMEHELYLQAHVRKR